MCPGRDLVYTRRVKRRAALVLYFTLFVALAGVTLAGMFWLGWSDVRLGVSNAAIGIVILAGAPVARERLISVSVGFLFANLSLGYFADASHGARARVLWIASVTALVPAGVCLAVAMARLARRADSRAT